MSRQISVNQMIVIIFFTLSQPFRKSALRTIDSFSHNGFSPRGTTFLISRYCFFTKIFLLVWEFSVLRSICKLLQDGIEECEGGGSCEPSSRQFFTAVVLLKRHTIWYHAPHCKKSSSRNLFIWVNVKSWTQINLEI